MCRKRSFGTAGRERLPVNTAVCLIPCLILCLAYGQKNAAPIAAYRHEHAGHSIRSRIGSAAGLVFRSPRGKLLSDMTLSKLIKELDIAAVPPSSDLLARWLTTLT